MAIVKVYVPSVANFTSNGALARERTMELMAVLTQDEAGLYAAYIGLVPACKTEEGLTALEGYRAESVARTGNKLSYRDIGMFFRGIEEREYRR